MPRMSHTVISIISRESGKFELFQIFIDLLSATLLIDCGKKKINAVCADE